MINYVNNSYDNVLKPCDAQKFSTLTQKYRISPNKFAIIFTVYE